MFDDYFNNDVHNKVSLNIQVLIDVHLNYNLCIKQAVPASQRTDCLDFKSQILVNDV